MMPKAFTNLMDLGSKCILACESCIVAATNCEEFCNKNACSKGSQDFIEKSKETIASCEACIKVCDEMIVQFKNDGHVEHMEALNSCVKVLGECIKICQDSIDKCTLNEGCRLACRETRDVCERAVMAVDACIESCEKHEVHYMNIKKY